MPLSRQKNRMFLTFYKCSYMCHNYLNKVLAWFIHWLLAKGCHHREYSYKINPLSSSMLICCSYANIAQTLMLIYSKQQFFQLCKMFQIQTRAISLIFEVKQPNFQPMFLYIVYAESEYVKKKLISKNCDFCLKTAVHTHIWIPLIGCLIQICCIYMNTFDRLLNPNIFPTDKPPGVSWEVLISEIATLNQGNVETLRYNWQKLYNLYHLISI